VGIRVISYYSEDVEAVSRLIAKEFSVDHENSIDKSNVLELDQFGYKSTHLVASLGNGREDLGEWSRYREFKVEFQLRTALQHAWAAVSHKLDYKSAEDAPEAVRRRLFRLSALFELADEQFSSIRDESEFAKGAYSLRVREGSLDVPVDATSIEVFMSAGAREQLLQLSRHFNPKKIGVVGDNVNDERHKIDISDLVQALHDANISTLAALERYLSNSQHVEDVLAAMESHYLIEWAEGSDEISAEDLLTQIILVDLDRSEVPGVQSYTMDWSESMLRARAALQLNQP
jgi:hypothetical protein